MSESVGELQVGINYRNETGERMKVLAKVVTEFHDYCYVVEDLKTGEFRSIGIGPGYAKGWSVDPGPLGDGATQ